MHNLNLCDCCWADSSAIICFISLISGCSGNFKNVSKHLSVNFSMAGFVLSSRSVFVGWGM